jgi:DNA-binding NtrC family response regulator
VIRATDRCLVVEDNFLIFMDIENIILSTGFTFVDHASNVAQAMEHLHRRQYRMVLLDLKLGGENGVVVADTLTHLKIPFAVTTSFSRDDEALQALRGIPVISKPYVVDQVSSTIKELLSRSQ